MDYSDFAINIHRFVSSAFTLLAIVLLVRSVRGLRLKKPYMKTDRNIAGILLIFLYIQLAVGIILYIVMGNRSGVAANVEEASRQMSIKFWALEHFIIMMFALLLSQLGWIFISKSTLDVNKHKNTLFYFGTAILTIIILTGIGLIRR